MGELDGRWSVERVSGALPPMLGVEKRIQGARGVTMVGPLARLPFAVVGRSLRYRPPLGAFVDHLEPAGEGFDGRATVQGREYARFRLRRLGAAQGTFDGGDEMVTDRLEQQLVKHLDEGVAMEQNVLRMLDGMIKTTDDPELKEGLRKHRAETEQHAERLTKRLEAHGASPSVIREAGGIAAALARSIVDLARGDRVGRTARDAYATEHLEIASYQLLERVARRAGDEETAEVARRNRTDEEAMARTLDSNWDKFADLSLQEEGIAV